MLVALIVSEVLKELQASRLRNETKPPPQPNSDRALSTTSNPSTLIPSSTIAHLNALSPKSTRSALADLDQHFSKTSPLLNDTELKPHLQGLVSASVCTSFVVFNISVVSKVTNADSTETHGHTVILRDVRFDKQHFQIHWSDNDVNAVHCDCKAFEFRPPNENFCKHVVMAIIAAGLEILSIEHVSEDQFLTILNSRG